MTHTVAEVLKRMHRDLGANPGAFDGAGILDLVQRALERSPRIEHEETGILAWGLAHRAAARLVVIPGPGAKRLKLGERDDVWGELEARNGRIGEHADRLRWIATAWWHSEQIDKPAATSRGGGG